MLIIEPTRYGAGIILWGDSLDLEHLLETIYHVAQEETLGQDVYHFLLGLAYDVRHAFQGDRLVKQIDTLALDEIEYLGEQILWPYFLIQMGILRQGAAYVPTSAAHQADIYRLEYATEQALLDYDTATGRELIVLSRMVSQLPRDYLVEFISDLTYDWIVNSKPGKARFKKLPALLKKCSPYSNEYQRFAEHAHEIAEEKGCSPFDLSIEHDWPDFKW
jgi:hypothetical protein